MRGRALPLLLLLTLRWAVLAACCCCWGLNCSARADWGIEGALVACLTLLLVLLLLWGLLLVGLTLLTLFPVCHRA